MGDLARFDVQVPLVQRLLDLISNGHTKGKQSVKNVTPQLVVKKGNPIDARDMVAEADVLEPTKPGFGRSEEHALVGAQGQRDNHKQGSFEPTQCKPKPFTRAGSWYSRLHKSTP